MTDPLDPRRFGWLGTAIAATVATHAAHLPGWLAIAVAAAIASRVLMQRRGRPPPSAWLRVPLTFALLLAVIATYGNVFGREPGSALACGLLALKLLETRRARDARIGIAFACFVLMSSLLFTSTLVFSLFVGCVLVLQLAALTALQPRGAAPEPRSELRDLLARAASLVAVGLPLAIVAFVLLPRLETPLWGARGADGVGRTGLSDTMAPGQFAQLMLDETPAFRVVFEGRAPRPSEQYFRTIVMTEFDGTTWRRRDDFARGTALPAPPAEFIAYAITLDATNQHWLPALDLPFTVPDDARLDRDQVLVARRPVAQARRYEVRSSPRAQLATALGARERARMLRLPDGYGPRARALAAGWRSDLGEDRRIVAAALSLFRSSFTYTLEPPPLARDSVDDFLFGTRRGFCEHYASAFVFLMRAAGIPARVVTGYQGGWWNGDYLLVRQSDAHAWAEIWRDGSGWVRVDPTAAVSPERVELGAPAVNASPSLLGETWRALRNQFDIASRLWTEAVVRFDSARQRGMMTQFGMADLGRRGLLGSFAVLLCVAMLLGTAWAIRGAREIGGDALDRAWDALRKRLARAGIDARRTEGPIDLLARVRAADPVLAARLAPLVDEYVALRYAGAEPVPRRVAALAARLQRLALPRRRRFTPARDDDSDGSP